MSDSFFTGNNYVDKQLELQKANATACEMLLDASVRRIAKIEGPLATAVIVQRVADICAGATVMPIEHWRSMGKVIPEKVTWRSRVAKRIARHQGPLTFCAGLILGLYFGGLH